MPEKDFYPTVRSISALTILGTIIIKTNNPPVLRYTDFARDLFSASLAAAFAGAALFGVKGEMGQPRRDFFEGQNQKL